MAAVTLEQGQPAAVAVGNGRSQPVLAVVSHWREWLGALAGEPERDAPHHTSYVFAKSTLRMIDENEDLGRRQVPYLNESNLSGGPHRDLLTDRVRACIGWADGCLCRVRNHFESCGETSQSASGRRCRVQRRVHQYVLAARRTAIAVHHAESLFVVKALRPSDEFPAARESERAGQNGERPLVLPVVGVSDTRLEGFAPMAPSAGT